MKKKNVVKKQLCRYHLARSQLSYSRLFSVPPEDFTHIEKSVRLGLLCYSFASYTRLKAAVLLKANFIEVGSKDQNKN